MNISSFRPVSNLLQAISPLPRLQILMAIGDAEPCVCHLEAAFGWRQAYLSQHLMALRRAGVVAATRKGRNIHYRIRDRRLLGLIRRAAAFQGVTLPALAPSRRCTCPNCKKQRQCV
jgi:DNA-binding transcriptional ArsR family regulator